MTSNLHQKRDVSEQQHAAIFLKLRKWKELRGRHLSMSLYYAFCSFLPCWGKRTSLTTSAMPCPLPKEGSKGLGIELKCIHGNYKHTADQIGFFTRLITRSIISQQNMALLSENRCFLLPSVLKRASSFLHVCFQINEVIPCQINLV